MLDEPSLGLAPLLVKRVFKQLDALRQQTSLTVVLVEQNFRMSIQVADSVVFMRGGRTGPQHDARALRAQGTQSVAFEAYLGANIDNGLERGP